MQKILLKYKNLTVIADPVIKFLFNMKVIATINHTIDKDTAEYIVKEFGHKAIIEKTPAVSKLFFWKFFFVISIYLK